MSTVCTCTGYCTNMCRLKSRLFYICTSHLLPVHWVSSSSRHFTVNCYWIFFHLIILRFFIQHPPVWTRIYVEGTHTCASPPSPPSLRCIQRGIYILLRKLVMVVTQNSPALRLRHHFLKRCRCQDVSHYLEEKKEEKKRKKNKVEGGLTLITIGD